MESFKELRADETTVILRNQDEKTLTVMRCGEDTWSCNVWVREQGDWEIVRSKNVRVANSTITLQTAPAEDTNRIHGVTLVIKSGAPVKSIPRISEYYATFRVAGEAS